MMPLILFNRFRLEVPRKHASTATRELLRLTHDSAARSELEHRGLIAIVANGGSWVWTDAGKRELDKLSQRKAGA
jgi:hypothetical protein